MKYEKPELKIVDFLSMQRLAYLDDQSKAAPIADEAETPSVGGDARPRP